MKRVLACAVAVIVAASARAEWKDLKKGMDHGSTLQCVGTPMLENQGHNGAFEIWTYDAGGFVVFEGGVVTYWEPSKPVKPVAVAQPVMHVLAPVARHVAKPASNTVAKD